MDENLVDMEHTMMKKPWVLVLKEFTAGVVVSSGRRENYTESRA